MTTRTVVILCFAESQVLDIAGPGQVFASATGLSGGAGYDVHFVSGTGGPVRTSGGLILHTNRAADVAGRIDIFIAAGGLGVEAAAADPATEAAVRDLSARADRICSVCTGAWLLADAGLLDGRNCTTHWQFAARLQQAHPAVRVDANPIFVRDGAIWTSAGVTAGIDMALALVEADFGRGLAMSVARRLVVYFKRPGGQAQFSAPLAVQQQGGFDALHGWILANLSGDLRVDVLAAQAGMSPRHFARTYTARTGRTPAHAVEMLRLDCARRALESGAKPKSAAAASGFGTEDRMRRIFLRTLGVSPTAYRQGFASGAPS